jgi:fructokinase
LVAGADVVKASDEDIAWLYPDTDPRQVAQDWFALGPSMVVVTFGSGGAHATTHAGSIHVAALTVPVADSVGAGDSFMAGLIAALDDRGLLGRRHITDLMAMDLNSAREVVEFAARCAAITVSRRGANPPTRAELQLSRPLAAPLCETLS